MKTLLTPRKTAVAVALMGLGAAHSQSVGPASGAAFIGRPLALSVPADFGTGEPCAKARVYYGDTRIADSNVRMRVRPAGQGHMIDIESPAAVNEPVVSVEVTAGCGNRSSMRRFTLLADPAHDDLPVAMALPVVTAAARPSGVATNIAGAPVPARAERTVPARAQREVPVRERSAPAFMPVRAKAAAGSGTPRLKLDAWRGPLEPVAAAAPGVLRLTTSLAAMPPGDAATRAAAAALWKILSAQPQDIQRELDAMKGMEREIGMLRTAAAQPPANVAMASPTVAPAAAMAPVGVPPALRAAGPLPVPSQPLPWAPFAVALLLAGAAAAWWHKRSHLVMVPARRWFERSQSPFAAVPAPDADTATQAPLAEPDSEPMPLEPVHEPIRPAPRVEALSSVVQQAEFLQALRLGGDAADVIHEYLKDLEEPPQMAFCELLRLAVETGDPAAVPAVKALWQKAYGTAAPALHEVSAASGIEAHPDMVTRMTRHWPSARVLTLIEEWLFAAPREGTKPLSLQAWRDLVWLHSLAQTILDQNAPEAAAAEAPAPEPMRVDFELDEKPVPVLDSVNTDSTVAKPAAAKPPASVVPLVLVARPERKRDIATYQDLGDTVAAFEGRWAHKDAR